MEFNISSDELDEKLNEIENKIKSNWEYLYKSTTKMQKEIYEIQNILKNLIKQD